MNEMITINNQHVERVTYQNEPIVTLNMVDQLHERADGTARRNFNEHREQFVEQEDFFEVPYEEWTQILNVRKTDDQESERTNFVRSDSPGQNGGYRGNMIFLTESGYLMLVKSFTDDLAWKVQRALVRSYFRAKEAAAPVEKVRLNPGIIIECTNQDRVYGLGDLLNERDAVIADLRANLRDLRAASKQQNEMLQWIKIENKRLQQQLARA